MKRTIVHALGLTVLTALFICGSMRAQSVPAAGAEGQSAQAAEPAVAADTATKVKADESFIIGNDDLLAISVWKEPDLTKQIPVRSDGKISMPLIGEMQAAGKTPSQLEHDIAGKLQGYITDPQVSVIVQEIRSLKFNVLGQVNKPGSYSLTSGTTVVDAIAVAGGFKDFAKKKGIYVLRQNSGGTDNRFSFNYQDFVKGKNTQQNIALKPHDTVVVP
jgi:polysaccharide biosynthesis/export protein